jgi:hypothetical protein
MFNYHASVTCKFYSSNDVKEVKPEDLYKNGTGARKISS